jgi:hypothetical protein
MLSLYEHFLNFFKRGKKNNVKESTKEEVNVTVSVVEKPVEEKKEVLPDTITNNVVSENVNTIEVKSQPESSEVIEVKMVKIEESSEPVVKKSKKRSSTGRKRAKKIVQSKE